MATLHQSQKELGGVVLVKGAASQEPIMTSAMYGRVNSRRNRGIGSLNSTQAVGEEGPRRGTFPLPDMIPRI